MFNETILVSLLQSSTPDPANQGLQDYWKLPSRCELELIRAELSRAAVLREFSLTPMVFSIVTDLKFFFKLCKEIQVLAVHQMERLKSESKDGCFSLWTKMGEEKSGLEC